MQVAGCAVCDTAAELELSPEGEVGKHPWLPEQLPAAAAELGATARLSPQMVLAAPAPTGSSFLAPPAPSSHAIKAASVLSILPAAVSVPLVAAPDRGEQGVEHALVREQPSRLASSLPVPGQAISCQPLGGEPGARNHMFAARLHANAWKAACLSNQAYR